MRKSLLCFIFPLLFSGQALAALADMKCTSSVDDIAEKNQIKTIAKMAIQEHLHDDRSFKDFEITSAPSYCKHRDYPSVK